MKSYVAKMELDNDTRWNIEQNGDLSISHPGKPIERQRFCRR